MKPILFNTQMVQAILEGKKTSTRRPVKKKYDNTHFEFRKSKYGTEFVEMQSAVEGETFGRNEDGTSWFKLRGFVFPKQPYKVGETLFVRETWQESECFDYSIKGEFFYKADFSEYELRDENMPNWKPSIHMPKEVARLFLKVINVRVERLNDISEADSKKEGIRSWTKDGNLFKYSHIEPGDKGCLPWSDMPRTAKEAFEKLWDSCYKGPKTWSENPWVWVIEFECIKNQNV